VQFFRCLILTTIAICHSCFALDPASCQRILTYIENNLPEQGVLKKSGNFVYVALDENYIHKLVSFIQDDGFEEPPYFGQLYDSGAHISVIYPEEWMDKESTVISEIGETICFQPKECKIWETPDWEGVESVWVILVDAPVLTKLRDKYGFLSGSQYHITIGVKPQIAKAA